MSKFNSTIAQNSQADTVNLAGGNAYSLDNKRELASLVLTSLMNGDSYYETEKARFERILSLCTNSEDAEFVAKAMIYTRTVGNLRSVSHIMANALVENVKGSQFLRAALRQTFVRPDDLTETLALWNSRNPKQMVPNVLRRAMKDALETYDNYQLKKYEGTRNKVKLRDVVKLAHPKSDKADFKALIEGALPAIQTAQTVNAGSENRADSYKEMLKNRKLGYMGALKNIKNILEANADEETIDMLCDLLRNEKACLSSRVLPFRFTQAYSMIESLPGDRIKNRKILKAIEDGFVLSAQNLEIVEPGEKVALLLDESGSMQGWDDSISDKSPWMIGKTICASMLTGLDKDNTICYTWADYATERDISGSPFDFIKRTKTQGGGTDVWAPFEKLIKTRTYVDKIVIFTDMQMYNIGSWSRYSAQRDPREFKDIVKEYRKINPDVKVLFWDLQGHGTTPMKIDHDILQLSGFSDKMLSVVPKIWKDKDALIHEIEAIQI